MMYKLILVFVLTLQGCEIKTEQVNAYVKRETDKTICYILVYRVSPNADSIICFNKDSLNNIKR